jgi:hypothetical protein
MFAYQRDTDQRARHQPNIKKITPIYLKFVSRFPAERTPKFLLTFE